MNDVETGNMGLVRVFGASGRGGGGDWGAGYRELMFFCGTWSIII